MRGTNAVELSQLPSMTALLKAAESFDGLRQHPRMVVTEALRDALDGVRSEVSSGAPANLGGKTAPDIDVKAILCRAQSLVQTRGAMRLVRVINATGVLLHTGLGRSVLAEAARKRVEEAAGYCNLEIDLATGRRGRRGQYAEQVLCRLTGAEAALIVNNNAAATMLVLHALALGREVVVSRGQLIEIGGSFRLPEVMAAGGAILRDIGTTNKTHLSDYEAAINEKTALLMHVHTSNYRVVGFTETPDVPSLADLAHRHQLPLFDDLGSGALLESELWAAADEPTAVASLRYGADVVAFSGDKLLGGPQAGIMLGRRATIELLRKDPMARAVRIDKLTCAALEATLELYQTPDLAKRHIPMLAALDESIESITARADTLAVMLTKALPAERFVVSRDESFAGGGSLPAWPLPTAVVRWQPTKPNTGGAGSSTTLDELARRLRLGRPGVLPRIHEGAMLFDLRTVAAHELEELTAAISAALGS
jgi:L-seryl-tRNA(Ser) seleniumtransferase